MSKKTARLYQRMQHGIQGKSDEVAQLEEKAAAAEAAEKKGKGKAKEDPKPKGKKRK